MENICDRVCAAFARAWQRLKEDASLQRHLIWFITLLAFLIILLYAAWFRAPADFPQNHIVEVPDGATVSDIAEILEAEKVIRSRIALVLLIELFGSDTNARAGSYYFVEPQNVARIAARIIEGDFGLKPLSIRIPEGVTVREMAELYAARLEHFDKARFIAIASELEGYLFPDTYQFLPTADEDDVIERMHDNFLAKVKEIEAEIEAFGRPLSDIVIMASLIEREAVDHEVRRGISGVLWNRLEIGMPLQVDAVFVYLINKGSFQLTRKDLQLDSPYNTYRYAGLPPGPIANPSLSSLKAAVTPEKNEYFFYLADRRGTTYFSRTFEEHKRKKALYLN